MTGSASISMASVIERQVRLVFFFFLSLRPNVAASLKRCSSLSRLRTANGLAVELAWQSSEE